MRHQSADNRTNDPEPDRPHKTHVHVHERFRSPPRDQTNDDVPNQMKHNDVSSFEIGIDRQVIRAPGPKATLKNCGVRNVRRKEVRISKRGLWNAEERTQHNPLFVFIRVLRG